MRVFGGFDFGEKDLDASAWADIGYQKGEPLRIDHFAADHVPALRRIIDASPLAEIIGRVLDSPIRFYMDQAFYKPRGLVAPTPWHQDTCYYNVAGNDLVRAGVSAGAV